MILSASGGLVYHARAAFTRFRSLTGNGDPWAPTRRRVSACIGDWLNKVSPDTLVIFGPSAGYLLETGVFDAETARNAAFQIVAVDPDPVAQIIFRARFNGPPLTWHRRHDLLPFTSATPDAFSLFLKSQSRGRTAVLFLGLLGQIDLQKDNFRRSKGEACRILQAALKTIPWASLHDLESTAIKPRQHAPLDLRLHPDEKHPEPDQRLRIEEMTDRLEHLHVEVGAWTDHETQWLGAPERQIQWLISPGRLHNLGFTVFSSGG